MTAAVRATSAGAERMRRLRERRRAERHAAARAAADAAAEAGLREAVEQRAREQLDQVSQALVASGQGALAAAGESLVDRVLAGSRELVIRVTGNPLLRQALLASADPVELARRLGCQPIEVVRIQQQADAELLDRLFGKAQQALRVDGAPAMAVQLVVSPGLAAQMHARGGEAQEIQGVAVEAAP